MALTEDRVLVSIQLNVLTTSVDIQWHDRILRDGSLTSVTPHRGAYVLDGGDLPESIKEEFGITLEGLFGEALAAAIENNAILVSEKSALSNELLSVREQLVAEQLKAVQLEQQLAELLPSE